MMNIRKDVDIKHACGHCDSFTVEGSTLTTILMAISQLRHAECIECELNKYASTGSEE